MERSGIVTSAKQFGLGVAGLLVCAVSVFALSVSPVDH